MNVLISRDLIYLNFKNHVCLRSHHENAVQVYMNSFKLQKDWIEQIIVRSCKMNLNMLTDNIISLQIFLINMNNLSNKEDNVKETEINVIQEVNKSWKQFHQLTDFNHQTMKKCIKKKSHLSTVKNIHMKSWQLLSIEASITSYVIFCRLISKTVQFAADTEITDTTLLTQLKFRVKKETETANILKRKQQQ